VVSEKELIEMIDDMLTHLEAMYHSGDVSEFIAARIPSEALTTGWMEQGLLRKGFAGNLRDKKNQENIVIPTDRFVRLTRDLEKSADTFIALFLLGKRGLKRPKFCSLVYRSPEENSEFPTCIAFWTKHLGTIGIANIVARHLLSQDSKGTYSELDLDYIERLNDDAASGLVKAHLSLEIYSDRMNVVDWMRDAVKNAGKSKRVISSYGDLNNLSKIGLLFSRWLTGLELFKQTEESLAAFLIMSDDWIDACMWDTHQGIATFASLNEKNLGKAIDRYLSPMWASPDDFQTKDSRTPEVVIRGESKSHKAQQKVAMDTNEQKTSVFLKQIMKRIDALESVIEQIESPPKGQSDNLEKSFMIIQTRVADVVDRLETLVTQLGDLENRLKALNRGG
jgi:hypothetical protein